ACSGSTWQAIATCPFHCTAQCYLQNAVVNCAANQNITLATGAKLDMCGRTLHCTDPLFCGVDGVRIDAGASNVQIFNSGQVAGTPTISGSFQSAINCNATS